MTERIRHPRIGQSHAPPRAERGRFYNPNQVSDSEAERLRAMAAPADIVSLRALGNSVHAGGRVVADLGAGDSTSLGAALTAGNPSLRYLPIDIRPDAVQAQNDQGFDAVLAPATDLPLKDHSVDAVHARFLFGWLDAGGAARAVREIVRVAREPARLVIIDYDWGEADGPPLLMRWKDDLLDLLTTFGFDPSYGRKLTVELTAHLVAAGLSTSDFVVHEFRTHRTATLQEALTTLTTLVEPVIQHMEDIGLSGRADRLRSHTAAVAALAAHDPQRQVTYPAMVAAVADISSQPRSATPTIGRGHPQRRVAADGPPPIGPAGLGVFRLDTGELIDQARRLQAAEYVRHGYHTADSVDADGFLVASIDPTGVVARSRYLGILDGDGQVGACIRMIDAVADELSTLPTIEKIEHSTPGGSVPALSLFHAGSVFEVSGLARSSRCPDPSVTTRLLLAVVSEARRRGDDFAVMGLVEPIATVLLNAYGRQAIRPLELPSIRVSGVGIRPAGLTLVPCSTRAVTFVDDIMTHLKTRPVSRFGRQTLELCEMTADAFAQAYGIHTPGPAGPPGDPIGCSPLTPS